MKWLYRIFRLVKCPHIWNIIQVIEHNAHRDDGGGHIYTKYHLKCQRCGKIKIQKV